MTLSETIKAMQARQEYSGAMVKYHDDKTLMELSTGTREGVAYHSSEARSIERRQLIQLRATTRLRLAANRIAEQSVKPDHARDGSVFGTLACKRCKPGVGHNAR